MPQKTENIPLTTLLVIICVCIFGFGMIWAFGGFRSNTTSAKEKNFPKTAQLIKNIQELNQKELDALVQNLKCNSNEYGVAKIGDELENIHYNTPHLGDKNCIISCWDSFAGVITCQDFSQEEPVLSKDFENRLESYCEPMSAKILANPSLFQPQPTCQQKLIAKAKRQKETESQLSQPQKKEPQYALPITVSLLTTLGEIQDQAEMERKISAMKKGYGVNSVDLNTLFSNSSYIIFNITIGSRKAKLTCWNHEDDVIQVFWDDDNDTPITKELEKGLENYCEQTSTEILADSEIFPK